jgi:hypothetical protein
MCDCNCNCCCSCWSYKGGKGCGGWIVLYLVLLVAFLVPGGWVLLVYWAVSCWPWLLGAFGLWIALRLLGPKRAPEPAPAHWAHHPDCNYRWACENDADYQSCNCQLADKAMPEAGPVVDEHGAYRPFTRKG